MYERAGGFNRKVRPLSVAPKVMGAVTMPSAPGGPRILAVWVPFWSDVLHFEPFVRFVVKHRAILGL